MKTRVGKHGIRIGVKAKEAIVGYAFALPFLVGFVIFFVAPFVISVGMTFSFGSGENSFVGLKNYNEVINSKAFKLAAWNTFRFILVAVPLIMGLALTLSLILKKNLEGFSFFRTIFLYPMVLPVASTVMFFQVLFSEMGILNTIYTKLNIPVQDWLGSDTAFGILVFLYIWKNCGYNIVLILSGLNAIPNDFYEAARVEGASYFQCLWRITIPIMVPTFFFVFVISIINSFKSFREAFLLCGEMPQSNSIYMLQHFMNNNFANLNYQRLSVAALLVFIVMFVLVFLLLKLKKGSDEIQL